MKPQEAYEIGLSIIPCNADKTPMVKWKPYQTKPAERGLIKKWFEKNLSMWAIVTGSASGASVLDFDGKEGKALVERFGIRPHVQTPNGFHWYLEYDPRLKTVAGVRKGLDSRGNGGYVIFSSNVKGKDYKWLRPFEPDPIESLPQELAKDLGLEKDRPNKVSSAGLVQWALKRVKKSGGRNNAGFELCCQLRDNRVPLEEARKAVLEFQNQCPDKNASGEKQAYSETEALRSLEQAYSGNVRTPWGHDLEELAVIQTTDSGFSSLFRECFGNLLLYSSSLGWLRYSGQLWQQIDLCALIPWAERIVKDYINQMLEGLDPGSFSSQDLKQALKFLQRPRLESIVKLSAGYILCEPNEFDRHELYLNTPSGVVELETGNLVRHDPDLRFRKMTNAPFSPDAEYPRFERFLTETFQGDEELINFFQVAMGYTLTGLSSERAVFFCHGSGANGKSVLFRVCATVLGSYASATPVRTILTPAQSDAIRNDLARLAGARLVTISESPEDAELDESTVKALTGGDKMAARFLNKEYFEFVPSFKIWVALNDLPAIRGRNAAIWSRIKAVPFSNVIPEAKQDKKLDEKLLEEAPGILRFLVEGAREYLRLGKLPYCQAVERHSAEYQAMQRGTSIKSFLEECTEQEMFAETKAMYLYSAYRVRCEKLGGSPLSITAFGKEMGNLCEKHRTANGVVYRGVRIKGIGDTTSGMDAEYVQFE